MDTRPRILSSPDSSPEYEAVCCCTAMLVTAIQNTIPSFTSSCLSKKLISEDAESYTLTDHSNPDKARFLVNNIRRSIQTSPNRFSVLIGVLKEFPCLENEVQRLQDEHGELCLSYGLIIIIIMHLH